MLFNRNPDDVSWDCSVSKRQIIAAVESKSQGYGFGTVKPTSPVFFKILLIILYFNISPFLYPLTYSSWVRNIIVFKSLHWFQNEAYEWKICILVRISLCQNFYSLLSRILRLSLAICSCPFTCFFWKPLNLSGVILNISLFRVPVGQIPTYTLSQPTVTTHLQWFFVGSCDLPIKLHSYFTQFPKSSLSVTSFPLFFFLIISNKLKFQKKNRK